MYTFLATLVLAAALLAVIHASPVRPRPFLDYEYSVVEVHDYSVFEDYEDRVFYDYYDSLYSRY